MNKRDDAEMSGTKDQLLIDTAVLQDCKKRRTNLAMAWMDYKKAYDSVPHSSIMETLEVIGVAENVKLRLTERMKIWKTQLRANNEQIGEVEINREIFPCHRYCLSSQCYLSYASYVRPLQVTNLARKREKSIIYCSWKM